MGVYLVTLIFSLFLAYCTKKWKIKRINRTKQISMGVFSLFPFWLISCLRYNVGTDYATYTGFYAESIPNGLYKSDYLFSLIVNISMKVFHNNYLIIIILATIFIWMMSECIYKYSENIYFSIILFFLTGTFSLSLNIMKQMVATAIWLNSLSYIKQKKIVPFLVMIFLAVGFHKIAILYAFTYILYYKQIPIKKSFPIILITLYLFSYYIRSILIIITRHFNFYYGYFYNIHDRRTGSLVLLITNICILILLMTQTTRQNLSSKKVSSIFYYNIQLICVIITVLMEIIPNADRIVYLFLPLQILSVPSAIKKIENKNSRYMAFLIILTLYSGLFIKLFILNNMGETFPFKWLAIF